MDDDTFEQFAREEFEARFPAVQVKWAGGIAPFQAEGTINGWPFYFRSRNSITSLEIYAKGENTRHIRHAQILERWPILPEPWARSVERTRMAAVDRTPGAATFGR